MKEYCNLLKYYKDCFSLVDAFHYNSNLTRRQYEKNLGNTNGKMISITHGGIKDNRQKKIFDSSVLRIGFIGNDAPYKGLPLLKKIIDGLNVTLHVWGGKTSDEGIVKYHGTFSQDTIESVYQSMDILVVPSVCKETFSLVTLEALSYGVPVLVSDNVGAQDIVKNYAPNFIFHSDADLRNILETLVCDRSELVAYNNAIIEKPWKYDILVHAKDVIERIYK